MLKLILTCACIFLIGVPAPLAAQTVAITGARVFTGAGPEIENGTVLMRDGRIVAIGADVPIPDGATRVDARGKWVTPGFINSATQVGLIEIGAETVEGNVSDNTVSAGTRVYDAFNPQSQLLPVTRTQGITTVVSVPERGLISGQAAAFDLAGERIEEMVIDSSVAVVAHINQQARSAAGGSRAGIMARLRQILVDASEYDRRREDYRQGRMQPLSAGAADLEALVPVLRGEKPLFVTAHRRSDIENALRLAREFNLKIVLVGAREAWMIADELATRNVPVVINPLDDVPSYDAPSPRLDNAFILAGAGVPILFATFDAHNARNIRQAAGNAVANGMDAQAALRALTADAAAVLGLEEHGTLAPGKVANVVIWSGDPFEFSTTAEAVYIRGQKMTETTRQRALLERYKTLLQNQNKEQ